MDPHVTTEFLQSAAASFALARLIYLRLARTFPAILAYVIFTASLNFAYAVMERSTKPYFWTYVVIGPFEGVFSILVVRELITLMFGDYPGIRTVGRWAMYVGIAGSGVATLVLTKYFWSAGATRRRWGIFYIQVEQRSVIFTLAVIIAAILFVLSKFPLRLDRSTFVSCISFSILFLSEAARLFIDATVRAVHNDLVDWSESVVIALCLGSWAFLVRPETAQAPRAVLTTPHEGRLLQQLDALNQMLTRAARR